MTAKTAKTAAPAPAAKDAPAKSVPYRNDAAWHAAHAASVGAMRGNAAARAALVVATHLAWRAPAATVAWHAKTNEAMLATSRALGIEPGEPVAAAMDKVLASLPAHDTTTALAAATTALAPAKK